MGFFIEIVLDHCTSDANCKEYGMHTQRPPLLLLGLCSLTHLDRVINHKVHELIEALKDCASVMMISTQLALSSQALQHTRILPSMRKASCSYSQMETVLRFCSKLKMK